MSSADTLLPEFDQEMGNTHKLLAALPATLESWKPHEKSMDFQRLAGHIAELPGWAVETIHRDSLDITPGPDQKIQPTIGQGRDQVLEIFAGNVMRARAAIAESSDAHLAKVWSLIFAGKKVIEMPRLAVLRIMVMNHLIHHRAQLGVYMRLKNIAIPGMYGPSADEGNSFAPARK